MYGNRFHSGTGSRYPTLINVDEVLELFINADGLVHNWEDAHLPVEPRNGVLELDPVRWAEWVRLIRENVDDARLVANVPSLPPAGTEPMPRVGELHPWAMAGLISLNVQTGLELQVRTSNVPHLLELGAIMALVGPQGAQRQGAISNLLALGTAIVTSGGSMTAGRLRRVIQQASREMMYDGLDFTREMVQRGWDFLSLNFQDPTAVGRNFEVFFTTPSAALTPISLRLTLMCQQTDMKMLTGVVLTQKAIAGYRDFPRQDLCDLIRRVTGVPELDNLRGFLAYINPVPEYIENENNAAFEEAIVPVAGTPGGRWAGWEFAFRTTNQRNFRNATFINILYAAVQLSIMVGGQMSLRQYLGTEGHNVATRPTIDTWVTAYVNLRVGDNNAFPAVPVQFGDELREVMGHNL